MIELFLPSENYCRSEICFYESCKIYEFGVENGGPEKGRFIFSFTARVIYWSFIIIQFSDSDMLEHTVHSELEQFFQFDMICSAQCLTMHFRSILHVRKCSRRFFISWQREIPNCFGVVVRFLHFGTRIISWLFCFAWLDDFCSKACFWWLESFPMLFGKFLYNSRLYKSQKNLSETNIKARFRSDNPDIIRIYVGEIYIGDMFDTATGDAQSFIRLWEKRLSPTKLLTQQNR